MKKINLLLLVLIFSFISTAQNKDYTFGKITKEEYFFKKEAIDSTANALVLFESGNSIFQVNDEAIVVKTTFYYKIKIYNSEGFKHGTFSIPIYNNNSNKEIVQNIKGITHNATVKTHLSERNVFTDKVNDNWKTVKFTMPNLKAGSVIEVAYTLVTPFKFNLTGWKFQSDIPKLASKYKASIPGNYIYNRKLIGNLRLKTNSSTIKKDCFHVTGYSGSANCEEVTYSMENIPAFIEEDYMTSPNNFKSKIKFELSETIWFDGSKNKYTSTWKEVDREFKTDKNIGGQLRKTKYFEDLIPLEIKNIPNDIDKAKAVYSFIQNYFTWNEKYSIFKDVKIKNAIKTRTGNVGELTISLINALKYVGLNAELLVISTRNNGFPTKLYPVISDFNYVIAKLNLNNKVYLLDVTNKLMPFGMLPLKCLNSYGRAMDFENDSYWFDITTEKNSKLVDYTSLELNEEGMVFGKIKRVRIGYHALNKREEYQSKSEDEIVDEFESIFSNLTVENYSIENLNNINQPLIETFQIEMDYNNSAKIYFNPFFSGSFKENPFKQDNRLYPVDFGYQRKYNLHFKLELPDNYKIISETKPVSLKLANLGGSLLLTPRKYEDYKFTLSSLFTINKTIFFKNEYNGLKEIFKQTINSQKTPIVITKIDL